MKLQCRTSRTNETIKNQIYKDYRYVVYVRTYTNIEEETILKKNILYIYINKTLNSFNFMFLCIFCLFVCWSVQPGSQKYLSLHEGGIQRRGLTRSWVESTAAVAGSEHRMCAIV